MTKRQFVHRLVAREPVERCGFWLGVPYNETWTKLHAHYGTKDELQLRRQLDEDVRWICPQFYGDAYRDPRGCGMFDMLSKQSSRPPLENCETIADLDSYPWPDVKYLNFDSCLRDLETAGDVYRLSGLWTCYYHNMAELFGMEEYFVKMHTHPELIHAATDRICEFYYEANERFFAAAGDMVDAFFFGNDFGTQLSLMCSPQHFDEFIMPWFRRFTELGHRCGYQVFLHSCGSIHGVIGRLIDAGVDCLHPIQALAHNMDAETLARDFGGKIAFMGGIDAQGLMTRGTPQQIASEVSRVQKVLGPHIIISPSHEAILPNVPVENIAALAQAARGQFC